MTVKSTELTKAMRRVLLKMARGHCVNRIGTYYYFRGSSGNVHFKTFRALRKRRFVVAWGENRSWYGITPAGRKALKDS